MSCKPLRTYKRASAAFFGRDYRDYYRTAYFFARGLHTRRKRRRRRRRRTTTRLLCRITTARASRFCAIVHRAIALVCPRNAITSRYSSVLSLAIIGKWRGNACAWQCWKWGGRNELPARAFVNLRFNCSAIEVGNASFANYLNVNSTST